MSTNNKGKRAADEKAVQCTKSYDRIFVKVTKGRKAMLQVHATKHGETLSAFINRAIDNQLLRDK